MLPQHRSRQVRCYPVEVQRGPLSLKLRRNLPIINPGIIFPTLFLHALIVKLLVLPKHVAQLHRFKRKKCNHGRRIFKGSPETVRPPSWSTVAKLTERVRNNRPDWQLVQSSVGGQHRSKLGLPLGWARATSAAWPPLPHIVQHIVQCTVDLFTSPGRWSLLGLLVELVKGFIELYVMS